MCDTNNENVIYNPTVQQLHDAFRDDSCEVWYVSVLGNHSKSDGMLHLGHDNVKSIYIKRKPKIVAKYGDFEFTQEELPQSNLVSGQAYYYTYKLGQGGVDYSRWQNDRIDINRAANKNVFLTEQAAEKWQQMLLSFQNNLLKGVNHATK